MRQAKLSLSFNKVAPLAHKKFGSVSAGLFSFEGQSMDIILYLLGAVLMAELIVDDSEEQMPIITLVISSCVWPLQALIIMWGVLFPKQPED